VCGRFDGCSSLGEPERERFRDIEGVIFKPDAWIVVGDGGYSFVRTGMRQREIGGYLSAIGGVLCRVTVAVWVAGVYGKMKASQRVRGRNGCWTLS